MRFINKNLYINIMSFSRVKLWESFWKNRNPKIEVGCKSNETMMIAKKIFTDNKINNIEDWGVEIVFLRNI